MEAMALIAAYKIAEPGDELMTDSEALENFETDFKKDGKNFA